MIKEMQLIYANAEPLPENGGLSWKSRLLRRRYHFPAGGGSDRDWSVRIGSDDVSCFFPLGTPDEETATAQARHICQLIAQQGWNAACQQFSRELVLSFEWSMNPVLWTYTTIHTLTGRGASGEQSAAQPEEISRPSNILVIEADEGIRRALCWSIAQQAPFVGIPCASGECFSRLRALHRPQAVLMNRNLATGLKVRADAFTRLSARVLTLTYSVYTNGDQMFDATPAGAEGYLIKRVKPERLLEPLYDAMAVEKKDPLAAIKSYFQSFLQTCPKDDGPRLAKLSRREREVLELLSKGRMDKEIAGDLGLSIWTVHDYVKSIFERLNVHSRTEAAVRYLEK
jgi:DNA-binding NarL/FixJ family response regulator